MHRLPPTSTLFSYTTLFRSFIPILGEYLTPQIVGGTGGVMIGNLIITPPVPPTIDRKSTRLNSSHANTSYAVFCLKKKKKTRQAPAHTKDGRLRHAEAHRNR